MTENGSVEIKSIEKKVVNQICSGQVILTLSTAVKELVENSMDANATSIQIRLKEYGAESIEVSDNGCGVEERNFQALTLKHYTSKISDFDDVASVETFGFRGEALSSLCTLSKVCIITRHKDSLSGTKLRFDHNGVITESSKIARQIGTTVMLENIFYTLPVRHKEFLRNIRKEFTKMCNVLYAYGLLTKSVSIVCTNQLSNKRLTVMETMGETLKSNITQIFGTKQTHNLLEIRKCLPEDADEEGSGEDGNQMKVKSVDDIDLEGFVSSCGHGCGRSSSDRQFYYINSRPVDNVKVSKLVNDVYRQYNPHQYPFVVLNMKIQMKHIDVNVTPDKRLIFMKNEKLLLSIVEASLHKIFKKIPAVLKLQNVGLAPSCEAVIAGNDEGSGYASPLDRLKRFRSRSFAENDETKCVKSKKSSARSVTSIRDAFARVDGKLKESFNGRVTVEPKCDITEVKVEIVDGFERIEEAVEGTESMRDVAERFEPIEGIMERSEPTKEVVERFQPMEGVLEISEPTKEVVERSESIKEVVERLESIEGVVERSEPTKEVMGRFEPIDLDIKKRKPDETDNTKATEPKRIRTDEGMTDTTKNSRKSITVNVTLNDIKRNLRKDSKTTDNDRIKFYSKINPTHNETAEKELQKELRKDSFKQMNIIGQFNLGFIITKLGSDIFIIDQHATDEKYNFETLQKTTKIQTQRLVVPQNLNLTIEKEELLHHHGDVIRENGFDFVFDRDDTPTNRVKLTAVPLSRNWVFGREDIDEMLFLLENAPDGKICRPSRVRDMFASRACRKSVMIGTALNQFEMRRLVDHMSEIDQPWNCPHGRPTIRHLINTRMIKDTR